MPVSNHHGAKLKKASKKAVMITHQACEKTLQTGEIGEEKWCRLGESNT
jgi:hypothetical protein